MQKNEWLDIDARVLVLALSGELIGSGNETGTCASYARLR